MHQVTIDGSITPAAELAPEADGGSHLTTSENKIVHPDWTHIMESYDRDYERQVASVEDRMQRYVVLSERAITIADLCQTRCATSSRMRAFGL